MKVILVALVLLFCVAKAQPGPSPLFAWAGNTFNSSTNFTLPSTSYASDSCVPETSYNSYFVAVNFTITTPGVYEVIALSYYEEFTVQLYLYAGAFDPSDPCTNYTRQLDRENYGLGSEAPTVDDFVYFTPGLYFLVAAGSSFDNYGNFAINVFAPTVTGDNFGSTALWNYTDYDYTQTGEDGCAVNDGPYTAPYVKWVWNQPDSGIYDIIVSWEKNATDVPNSIYTLLYFGNVSDADIQSDDPCIPSSGTSVIIGQNGEYGYSGTTIYGVSLTVKQVYTLVFSGDETDDFGRFSIFVVPTRVLTFHTTVLWTPPGSGNGLDSFYSTCPTPDTDADTYAWLAFSWQNTVGETTLVALSDYSDVSGWAGEPDWTYTYLYSGENDGSDVTAPSACPLVGASFIGGWDENVPALIGPINTTYSLVVQDWDGDSINYPTTAVIAFVLTGIPVGSKNASAIISTTTSSDSTTSTPDSTTSTPDSTSTSSSSSSSTSASSTTSSPSSTSSSSSSSSSSTNSSSTTTSSTSGAETVVASFLFVLGAFLII